MLGGVDRVVLVSLFLFYEHHFIFWFCIFGWIFWLSITFTFTLVGIMYNIFWLCMDLYFGFYIMLSKYV
jgi:hypothetical protein